MAEVLKSGKFTALYRDEKGVHITIGVPHTLGVLGLMAGRLYFLVHRKIKEEKIPVEIESYEFEFARPLRLLYRVRSAEKAEEVYNRVVELFYECLLEVFSEPHRLMDLEMKMHEFSERLKGRESSCRS